MEAIKLFLNNLFVWTGFIGSIIALLFFAYRIIRFLKFKLSFRRSIKTKRKISKLFSYSFQTNYDLRQNFIDDVYAQFLFEKKEARDRKRNALECISERGMIEIAIDKAISNLGKL